MSDLNSIGGLHYEMMKRCYNEKSVMYNCSTIMIIRCIMFIIATR